MGDTPTRFSKRTRWTVGVLLFGSLGYLWYWMYQSMPRRSFSYLAAGSVALALLFEALARKVLLPRNGAARFLLELLFAMFTAVAANWFMSIVLPAR